MMSGRRGRGSERKRSVQRFGLSSLAVTLPKDWVENVGLKPGDEIEFLGKGESLKIVPSTLVRKGHDSSYVINSDVCSKPRLLSRVLTGCYVTGKDVVYVKSRGELSSEHLDEVHSTVRRLIGMEIVEESLREVKVQCFIEPSRFPVYNLLKRMHLIISSMFEVVLRALVDEKPELTREVVHLEEEVDRIYWLVVRQLLSTVEREELMGDVGVERGMHLLGNRAVAKSLELIGDSIERSALTLQKIFDSGAPLNRDLVREVYEFGSLVKSVLDKAVKAFFFLNVGLANDALEEAYLVEKIESDVIERIMSSLEDARLAVLLCSFVWGLAWVADNSNVLAEITINRAVEDPSRDLKEFLEVIS